MTDVTCACCACQGIADQHHVDGITLPFFHFIEHRHGCDGGHGKREPCNRAAPVTSAPPKDRLTELTEERDRWRQRWEATVEDAQVARDALHLARRHRDAALAEVSRLTALLDETEDVLMSIDPELQRTADENRRLSATLERLASYVEAERTKAQKSLDHDLWHVKLDGRREVLDEIAELLEESE